ncbi:MAG: CoA-binding protein [Planctomycetota bacterium]|nr:CoA-binding protein [Planctomycetota bacterium]
MDIDAFLDGSPFAVVGASASRAKYGNKVLRAYLQNGLKALPVNPNETEVEGLRAYDDLMSLPEQPHGISIITQPHVTERIVEDAAALGIAHVWMQPGAESDDAVENAKAHGMNVIFGGPCLLVRLGFSERGG